MICGIVLLFSTLCFGDGSGVVICKMFVPLCAILAFRGGTVVDKAGRAVRARVGCIGHNFATPEETE